VHLIKAAADLYQAPSFGTFEGLLFAVAIAVAAVLIRVNPLKAQDRLIRLEEHLRYRRVLPEERATRAIQVLTERQIIALRFAGDAELAELVQQVLDGKLKEPKEIKQAVKNWRADHFRV
jgi:hypothetical protein